MNLRRSRLFRALVAGSVAATMGSECSENHHSTRPFLLTLNSTNGLLFVVHLRNPRQPELAAMLRTGSTTDSFLPTLGRTEALAADTETASLVDIRLSDVRNPKLAGSLPATFASPLGPVCLSGDGSTAVILNDVRDRLRTVDFTRLAQPSLSSEVDLLGAADGVFSSVEGSVVVLTIAGRPGEVSVIDSAEPGAVVRAFPWPTSGSPTSISFSPLPGDQALAAQSGEPSVFVLGLGELPLRSVVVEGAFTPSGSPIVAIDAENRQPRGLAATLDGAIVRFDFTNPAAPSELSRLLIGRALSSATLDVSPDDSFALLSDGPGGRLDILQLGATGEMRVAGSFALGGAISRTGFSSDREVAAFRDNPFAFALAGTSLFLANLAGPAPLLSSGLDFSAVEDFFVVPEGKGNVIAGIQSSGRVFTIDVSRPQAPMSVASADLGIGAGVHRAFFVLDDNGD